MKNVRVVVDVNLFISGIISLAGNPYQLLEHWRNHVFTLLISQEIIEELADVLQRPRIQQRLKISPDEVRLLLDELELNAELVVLPKTIPLLVRDPKDDSILATALGGDADYLVTGDQDLLVLHGDKRIGSLQIITVNAFLAIIASAE